MRQLPSISTMLQSRSSKAIVTILDCRRPSPSSLRRRYARKAPTPSPLIQIRVPLPRPRLLRALAGPRSIWLPRNAPSENIRSRLSTSWLAPGEFPWLRRRWPVRRLIPSLGFFRVLHQIPGSRIEHARLVALCLHARSSLQWPFRNG